MYFNRLQGLICQNIMKFISWAIIKRIAESESILLKRGIEAHFRARLQPYSPHMVSYYLPIHFMALNAKLKKIIGGSHEF